LIAEVAEVAEVAESRRPIKDKHQFLRWKMNLINAFSVLSVSVVTTVHFTKQISLV